MPLSLLVPQQTTDSQVVALLNHLRLSRKDGSLVSQIPATTPGNNLGEFAVADIYIFSDPKYAVPEAVEILSVGAHAPGDFYQRTIPYEIAMEQVRDITLSISTGKVSLNTPPWDSEKQLRVYIHDGINHCFKAGGLRGFAPARRGPFVSAKGPKTIGARAWPSGCLCPSPSVSGLRNSLRSDSPRPHRGFGTAAQPRPQAPGHGAMRWRS